MRIQKFTFKFLLSGGGTEWWTFVAHSYEVALASATAYADLAFAKGEVLDFFWEA